MILRRFLFTLFLWNLSTISTRAQETLFWSEEFNQGNGINTDIWEYDTGNGGNGELQNLKKGNVLVVSSRLTITAKEHSGFLGLGKRSFMSGKVRS